MIDCTRCGEPINLDLMRCEACGHDMLPQDITQRPGAQDSSPPRSPKQFAEALLSVEHAIAAQAEAEATAARSRRTGLLIGIVLAVMTTLALVLSRL